MVKSGQRAAGLRLEASDIPWPWSEGPAIRGTGEAILIGLAGRHSVLSKLEGEGVSAPTAF